MSGHPDSTDDLVPLRAPRLPLSPDSPCRTDHTHGQRASGALFAVFLGLFTFRAFEGDLQKND
jgi:hypothetical protein